MKNYSFLFILCVFSGFSLNAQIKADTSDMIFSGTKLNPYSLEYDSTSKVSFSGYIDTYYSYYTDTVNANGYEKFPTTSPRNNSFGLNMLQFGAKYESEKFRGTATVFFGDCPSAAWSNVLNFIQEANVGFKVYKKLWLDAGFFRTHLGLESIQPRENMTLSLATTTYFEPYFLSGAKLTWHHSRKFTIQANVFNSFNQFIETNNNKVLGLSMAYTPNDALNISLSSIVSDESANNFPVSQNRSYTNLYVVYKKQRFILGFEANYGYQEHSKLSNPAKGASMYSSLLAFKYRFTAKFASYLRGEMYSDPDEILTGPVQNENHELVGLDLYGATFGLEYKPIPNSYFRVESSYLHTKSNERIFYYDKHSTNVRYEFRVGIGVWF